MWPSRAFCIAPFFSSQLLVAAHPQFHFSALQLTCHLSSSNAKSSDPSRHTVGYVQSSLSSRPSGTPPCWQLPRTGQVVGRSAMCRRGRRRLCCACCGFPSWSLHPPDCLGRDPNHCRMRARMGAQGDAQPIAILLAPAFCTNATGGAGSAADEFPRSPTLKHNHAVACHRPPGGAGDQSLRAQTLAAAMLPGGDPHRAHGPRPRPGGRVSHGKCPPAALGARHRNSHRRQRQTLRDWPPCWELAPPR